MQAATPAIGAPLDIIAFNCVGRLALQLGARMHLDPVLRQKVDLYPWEVWCSARGEPLQHSQHHFQRWWAKRPHLLAIGLVVCSPTHAVAVVVKCRQCIAEVMDSTSGAWSKSLRMVMMALNQLLPTHDILVTTANHCDEGGGDSMTCKPRALQALVLRLTSLAEGQGEDLHDPKKCMNTVHRSEGDVRTFAHHVLQTVEARFEWAGDKLSGTAVLPKVAFGEDELTAAGDIAHWPKGIARTSVSGNGTSDTHVLVMEQLHMDAAAHASAEAFSTQVALTVWPVGARCTWCCRLLSASFVWLVRATFVGIFVLLCMKVGFVL